MCVALYLLSSDGVNKLFCSRCRDINTTGYAPMYMYGREQFIFPCRVVNGRGDHIFEIPTYFVFRVLYFI